MIVPWRVYEILARVALRDIDEQLAQAPDAETRARLEAERALLERVLSQRGRIAA